MLERQSSRRIPLVVILIIIVGALTVGPVVMLVIGSFSEGIGAIGTFTTDKYVAAYTDPALPKTLLNTVIFTLGTACFSTILGGLLAYLSVRTDIPFKGLFRILPIVPMMIPHVLFAAAWIALLNPTNGMLNLFLRNLFGLSSGPFNIYSLGHDLLGHARPAGHMPVSRLPCIRLTTLEGFSGQRASNLYTLRGHIAHTEARLLAFTLAIIRAWRVAVRHGQDADVSMC